jgi:hypothetical protein
MQKENRVKVDIYPIMLDLGCGENKKEGYIGLDFMDFGQEIKWDITEGIPLPDDSVSELFSSHFVEHIEDKYLNDLIHEMIRVCKDESVIEVRCPRADTNEAYFTSHLSLWDERRVRGICMGQKHHWPGHLELIEFENVGIEIRFKLRVIKNNIRK